MSRIGDLDTRMLLFAVTFVVVGTFVGGLTHNPFDPARYAKGAIGILEGANIYRIRGVVYPPPLYVLSSVFLYVASLFTRVQTNSYVTIATFVGIGTTMQALAYVLGSKLVCETKATLWAFASLYNPFVVYVLVLFGQMESFIVLGLVGVLYAEHTSRWEVGGALLAVAASVKIYPAILFLPFVWRNRQHAFRIVRGAVPVGVVTVLLMIPYFPDSLRIFFSALWGVRPINALYIVSLSTVPSWVVSGVFVSTFVLAGVVSAVIEADRYVAYLLPLVPVVLFYSDVIEYRWLPLTVGVLLIGYSRGPSPKIRRLCRRYGWGWIALGTVALVVASLRSLYVGDPWLVPTFDVLPELSTVFSAWYPSVPFADRLSLADRTVVELVRTGIAIVFIVSVLNWCRLVFEGSRLRISR